MANLVLYLVPYERNSIEWKCCQEMSRGHVNSGRDTMNNL